jgi:hypothetical protein
MQSPSTAVAVVASTPPPEDERLGIWYQYINPVTGKMIEYDQDGALVEEEGHATTLSEDAGTGLVSFVKPTPDTSMTFEVVKAGCLAVTLACMKSYTEAFEMWKGSEGTQRKFSPGNIWSSVVGNRHAAAPGTSLAVVPSGSTVQFDRRRSSIGSSITPPDPHLIVFKNALDMLRTKWKEAEGWDEQIAVIEAETKEFEAAAAAATAPPAAASDSDEGGYASTEEAAAARLPRARRVGNRARAAPEPELDWSPPSPPVMVHADIAAEVAGGGGSALPAWSNAFSEDSD